VVGIGVETPSDSGYVVAEPQIQPPTLPSELENRRSTLSRLIERDESIKAEMRRVEDVFISHNTHLAMKLAYKAWMSSGRCCDYLDLVQRGLEGMVKAFRRFDPDRGYRFSTFAIWIIRRRIQAYIRDYAGDIRVAMITSPEGIYLR
jgi:DNA-directed RNA polymerase sigma subunit (sigma70/sigma32)